MKLSAKTNAGTCLALGAVLFVGACGKQSATSATPFTDAIELIDSGVGEVGSGLLGGATLLVQNKGLLGTGILKPLATHEMVADNCNEHGMPKETGTPNDQSDINQSDDRYPYLRTYCGLTVIDGDTVRGSFELTRSLICTLEKGGIQFSGTEQAITPDFTDTECWPNGGPGDNDEELAGIVLAATGSSPAAFNSHFDKGVVFTVDALGLTFKIAANLDSDKIEFIGNEEWSGGGNAGNKGVFAGEITQSTGVLKFEKRDERARADCTDSSCGWNRHTRILANLTMVDGEPNGLESFEYGYSDIQLYYLGGGNPGGTLVGSKGSVDGEIKARVWTASEATMTDLQNPSNWTSSLGDDNQCYSSGVIDDAADCSSEAGVSKFSSTTSFALYSSPAHTDSTDWLTNFSGFNFDSVDLDQDVAY